MLPLAFGVGQLATQGGDPIAAIGSWFLFWGVGTRLVLAGVHQVLRPEFTVRNVLAGASADAAHIARRALTAGASRRVAPDPVMGRRKETHRRFARIL